MTDRSRVECLAAADAIEGALHLLDDEDSAQTLARLADQWRAEADANCGRCHGSGASGDDVADRATRVVSHRCGALAHVWKAAS